MLRKLVRQCGTALFALGLVHGVAYADTVGPADPTKNPGNGSLDTRVIHLVELDGPPVSLFSYTYLTQMVSLPTPRAELSAFTFSGSFAGVQYIKVDGTTVSSFTEDRQGDWSWYTYDLSALPIVTGGTVTIEIWAPPPYHYTDVKLADGGPLQPAATSRHVEVLNGAVTFDSTTALPSSMNFLLSYAALPVPEPSTPMLYLAGLLLVGIAVRKHW